MSRGKVTADRLNVRSWPSPNGTPIGVLTENSIVDILGQKDRWLEIRYNGVPAFVHGGYIEPVDEIGPLKGKILAALLNVRDEPGLEGAILGTLTRDTILDIVAQHGDWLEIRFNGMPAFIHSDYVERLATRGARTARVTAGLVNVRGQPAASAEIVGSLAENTLVTVHSRVGKWWEIRFNHAPAFVHGDYVEVTGMRPEPSPEAEAMPPPSVSSARSEEEELDLLPLEPAEKLPVTGTATMKKVTRTWNRFGNLLEHLSGLHELDPGTAVAVLCVESSGKGFEPRNRNRLIIRFENHIFWRYWGKDHADTFHQHFKFGRMRNGKRQAWLGHAWRAEATEEWQTFHGDQAKEWRVLEFARSLDDTAALYAISMGAPQIMGFHYERIGCASVQEMFDQFSYDLRYHILGLFEFLDRRMINALKRRDFVAFAGAYNGSGQKTKYGGWIEKHYAAFQASTT